MVSMRPPKIHISVGTPTLLKLKLLMKIKFLTNAAGNTRDNRRYKKQQELLRRTSL